MDPDDDSRPDVSRRDALKKLGVAAGVAWSAPVVMSFTNAAGAATGSPVTTTTTTMPPPDPECMGATCETFRECSSLNPDCICITTPDGGLCVPGSTSCEVGPPCEPGNVCPDGFFCAIDTCCGFPVCTPVDVPAACPPDPALALGPFSGAQVRTAAGTFAGR
jgi:hypothetical protein